MPADRKHVVLVHGLWMHALSWEAWAEVYREAGYDPISPGWPGEPDTVDEAKKHPERVAGFGINEITEHYAKAIAGLDSKPIAVGHSFGGLIVQKLLGQNLVSRAVAIDAAPIKGVLAIPPSALKVASIALRNPATAKGSVALTFDQFMYGFANTLEEKEARDLYDRWMIPSPGRPLFQAAAANFTPNSAAKVEVRNKDRGPLLLIAGGRDKTVPAAITRSTRKLYAKSSARTDFHEYPDRGHSLTVDNGWREVADFTLDWLKD